MATTITTTTTMATAEGGECRVRAAFLQKVLGEVRLDSDSLASNLQRVWCA